MTNTIDREALELALHKHGPLNWDDSDIGILADCAEDLPDDCDAENLAHGLWTMGGRDPEHADCRYDDGDSDGDYENNCEHCETWLTNLSTVILADLIGARS